MTHTKANKSKIFALFFNLIMYLALILGIVFASPTSTVYAEGGTGTTGGLTIGGKTSSSGDGYVYDGATQTLTLQSYNGKEIYFYGDVIQLEGNNTITVDKTSEMFPFPGNSAYNCYSAIYSRGTITITGSGSLAVNMETSDVDESCYGIYAKEGMTINGGNIAININSYYGGAGHGLYSNNGSVIIGGSASLDITTKSNAIETVGNDIVISGTGSKKIQVNVGDKNWVTYAIKSTGGNVDISGPGKVTILYTNGDKSHAINADKQIKIHSKADVETSAMIRSYLIDAAGSPSVEISDSTVKIQFIYLEREGFVKITDSNVTIKSEYEDSYRTGCVYGKKVEILGKSNVLFSSKYGYPFYVFMSGTSFQLSEGGSVTLESYENNSESNDSHFIKLGNGTVMETGKKLGEATTGEWKCAYQYYKPAILRFVYSATAPASVVADDVTISGITDAVLTEQDIKLTITGDNFKAIAKDTDVTAWFKNMPKGLSAKVKADVAAGATEMTITISGTPTEASSAFILIEIPVGTLQTATYSLLAKAANMKFDIVSGTPVAVPTPVPELVYNTYSQVGVPEPSDNSYTVENGTGVGAGTYTATLKLNKGFKWTDGTTAPKTVTWEITRVPDVEIEVTLTQTEYPYTGFDISAYFKITAKGTGIQIDKSECDIIYTNNKEVGEATVVIKDNGKGNYAITNTVTKNFTIVKRTTGEPTGLTGIAPSEEGAMDGKITGTTADMEYSADTSFTSPKPCMDGETTGFAEGTYYVRYKSTATTEASNYVAVHVRLNTVTVVDGNGSKVTKYKSGSSVTVTVTIPTGKSFIKWVYEGVTIPTTDITKQEITFTMPEKDVVLTALFEDIIYNIMVTNGTSSATTAKYQEEETVTANAPATGKEFDKWVVTGITLPDEDLAKSTVTFEMPASNVTMEATYKDVVYKVTVKDATATPEMSTYQTEVTVTANAPATGKEFDKWVVTGITLSDEDLAKSTVTFEMPASNVTMEATYKDVVYKVTVKDATATPDMATYQTEVTVTANEPGDDEYFDKWEVTGLDTTGMDLTKTEIKFQMPAGNVTFKATYLTIEKFEIYVVDGTKDKSPAKAGETITIIANPAKEGKVFDKWTCETAGVTIVFESATSSKTTFEMPACEITIQAHFRDIEAAPSIEIKVEGGTGAGTYKEGDSVTITANDPAEGKVFKGWQDASGKIVSTEKSYTFTVTDVTTLTAVYDDMPSGGGEINPPAKKDGLSGGQIAGIIIGSVAVAGIIGFAVLWFAVKKKTFADLGVALKKGFTAIGNFFKNLGAKIKALFTKKK